MRATRMQPESGWLGDVLGLVVMDMRQFFDNRLFAVSTLLTSVSMVLAFGAATDQMVSPAPTAATYFGFVFPGIIGAGIMFSCTYTVGYTVIIDRNRRTIEDLILSPLSYSGFLLARIIGVVLKCLFQFVLVLLLGVGVFDARIESVPMFTLGFFTACTAFAGLGILIATYTNEISFPAVVNIIVIPLMYFAGIFFPLDNLGTLGDVFDKLPLAVHVDMFRAATSADVSATGASVLAVAYSFLALSVAAWAFRRRIGHG
ncbi:ABC transporter permease [Streptomyces sp. NPDC055952]|uniref:ABC transporter permease n=1 Tax=Streptomyces sp. NPDC055952 TaxID=3345663 RepID=UPI0035E36ADE